MLWYDWLILVLPVCFVMWAGFRTRRYIRGVSDFLSAGRLAGRYVLSVGNVANALSIIGLVTFVEIHYKTGFSVGFWSSVLAPISIMISLTGYCYYRFRETRAMSLGQFLEMRYSRSFRIFAASLRSLAEMVANMVMPALASRFFIQLLGLPETWSVFGFPVSTYVSLMVLFLTLAISLICFGGTLSIVVTDTIQGMILYPVLACFIIFLFAKFSVSGQIMPVMADRVAGESFINPFDVGELRDFNLFTVVIVGAYGMIVNRANWIGTAASTSARSPHEQKMAGVLGAWRDSIGAVFYILVACALITFLNHADFAGEAHAVRQELAARVADDVLKGDAAARDAVKAAVAAAPAEVHRIGIDAPLSQADNPDSRFLNIVHGALLEEARAGVSGGATAGATSGSESTNGAESADAGGVSAAVIDAEGVANDRFQQCRTLFHQLSLSATMRAILPNGLFGLFALLLFLAMLSTDDSRIFSATLTIAQDVVLPLRKKPFTPRGHIWMVRIVAICIGLFFLAGSYFMKQLDYMQMFNTLAVSMWMGGAGPVMVFGFYSTFGTTAGAWAALLTSMISSIAYILVQRNWADVVYPALAKAGLVDACDRALRALSAPFSPYIKWSMDAVKCPVNTIEFMFFLSLLTLVLYVVVSKLTCKCPFDLDAMLHRTKRTELAKRKEAEEKSTTHGGFFSRLVGITPEYTRGDRIIAWGVFFYSFGYAFGLCFLAVVIWNLFGRWPDAWWSRYFVVVHFAVPCIVAAISTVWFSVGGILGLRQLFHDLAARREIDARDNGRVGD